MTLLLRLQRAETVIHVESSVIKVESKNFNRSHQEDLASGQWQLAE